MQSVQVKKGNKFTVSKHHVSYLHSYAVCVYKFLRTLAWYFSTKNSSYSKNTSRFTLTTSNITNIALHSLMLISFCEGTQTGNHRGRSQTPPYVSAIYILYWQNIHTSNFKHCSNNGAIRNSLLQNLLIKNITSTHYLRHPITSKSQQNSPSMTKFPS